MPDPTVPVDDDTALIQAAPSRDACYELARRLAAVIDDPANRRLTRFKMIDLSAGEDVLHRAPSRVDDRPPCYGCSVEPAGHDRWPASAWCSDCQPYDLRPSVTECQCPRCYKNFPGLAAFDEHIREVHDDRPILRVKRRTTTITTRSLDPGDGWPVVETFRLCEIPCRTSYLAEDLELPARGGWAYPSSGTATAEVRGKTYEVSWKRNQASAKPCDICGDDEWRYEIPALEAARLARSARMRGVVPAGLTPRVAGSPPPGKTA